MPPTIALGYLRALPELPIDVQRERVTAYCAQRDLVLAVPLPETPPIEAASDADDTLLTLVRSIDESQRTDIAIVVAGFDVLADDVRTRARHYLLLGALGITLHLADGTQSDRALVDGWDARGPSERRGERVREAMRRKALRGQALGRPPYGYRIEERHLVPEPPEADVIRRIFRACVEDGAGVRRIAQQLNASDLRTRRRRPWSTASIRDILRNAVYTGTYRRLGVVVQGAHEALVTRGQFETAQRLTAKRRTSPSKQRRRQYLLSGIASCGYCGGSLIGMRRSRARAGGEREEVAYYQCASRTNHGRCDYHTRRAAELETQVRTQIGLLPAPATGGRPPSASPADQRNDDRTSQRTLDHMLDMRASGQWTAQQLLNAATPLVLSEFERSDVGVAAVSVADARSRLTERWDELPSDERRALLTRVVARAVVTDDEVTVTLVG
ncbi:MAG TPA: recombinase family protein [Dehalococcoidia bacterium]|nr:recombinase family protein [Dehalococcoidia bacterium]